MSMSWSAPWWFDELPSTNGWLLERLRAADVSARPPPGTVVAARRQTAGRGRQGRVWLQEAGRGLAVSFVARAPEDLRDLGALGMATAAAVAEWVVGHGGVARLKWPNDVLVLPYGAAVPPPGASPDAGAWGKLSGVLVEGSGERAVVGMGINCLPSGAARNAAGRRALSLAEALPPGMEGLTPETLLTELLSPGVWPAWVERWRNGGFEALRPSWEGLAVGVGASVRTVGGGETRSGTLEGFGPHGEALVRDATGRRSSLWVELSWDGDGKYA